MRLDPSTLVLAGLAIAFAIVAYLKDPSLPLIGARNGFKMLAFILPRLVPALVLAGLTLHAVQTGAWTAAAFVGGFCALFLWQSGGYFRRNRPGRYRPDDPPRHLVPGG